MRHAAANHLHDHHNHPATPTNHHPTASQELHMHVPRGLAAWPAHSLARFVVLAARCTAQERDERPTAAEVGRTHAHREGTHVCARARTHTHTHTRTRTHLDEEEEAWCMC